jgi:hypothetical protein
MGVSGTIQREFPSDMDIQVTGLDPGEQVGASVEKLFPGPRVMAGGGTGEEQRALL